MLDQEVAANWVANVAALQAVGIQVDRFIETARLAWPRVLACTKRSVYDQQINAAEAASLALEIWEATLRSVWMTLQQTREEDARIENLSNYLIGAFRHRLIQHLKKSKHRDAFVDFVSPEALSGLERPEMFQESCAVQIHRKIQLTEIYTALDESVRQAVIARTHGFSWREIADDMGIEKQNLIMRVRYAIRKMRDKFAGSAAELNRNAM
jgi:DNA-directed RNA polymerase specialized sigma24 family protein